MFLMLCRGGLGGSPVEVDDLGGPSWGVVLVMFPIGTSVIVFLIFFDVASWNEDKLEDFAFHPFKVVPVSPRRVVFWCAFILHQHSRRPSLNARILYLVNLLIYLEKDFATSLLLGKAT